MFRLWGKLYKDNTILKDIVICNGEKEMPVAKKLDQAIYEICMHFDLQKPLWLKNNEKDFHKFKMTTFRNDHFIEEIDFDYLEIEVIEEDEPSSI